MKSDDKVSYFINYGIMASYVSSASANMVCPLLYIMNTPSRYVECDS